MRSLLAISLALTATVAEAQASLPLIPLPAAMTPGVGSLLITNGSTVSAPDDDRGAAVAAQLLIGRVRIDRGLTLEKAATGVIRFKRDPSIASEEGYKLDIDVVGATIRASSDRGFIWGAMTLSQLLSPDAQFGKPVTVSAVSIDDAPRFSWRGLMIDVARHFQPVETLYPVVDAMAAQKLNTLHLHLTDDQGWRVEIKRYPKLTEIGAWRTPPSAGGAPATRTGGFYTQEQLRQLVAYAAERGIVIVPEIDLPGHAQAAVAAYPEEIGVLGDQPEVGHAWGINPWLFSPSPRGMAFIRNVLDELVEIFPSQFIHVGGDEAVKDQWQRSPEVQARMKALGLKTENQLQGWMIAELGEYLTTKGRRLIGWDEILEGDIPISASVMSWRGEKGAVDAANRGHDVVLSPAPDLYLDNLQSNRSDEPPGRLAVQTLKQIYGYEPAPAGIDPDRMRHVLGAQANAWSEYLATAKQKEHAIFPRLSAVAELTWSPRERREWTNFVSRLDPQMLRYRRQGIAAADSAFAVDYRMQGSRGDALRAGKVTLALDSETGAGMIRYVIGGKELGAQAHAYTRPLTVPLGTRISAAAFTADGHATATPRTFDTSRAALLTASASYLAACPEGALGLRVPLAAGQEANAPAFNVNIFDTCTQWLAAPLGEAKGFRIEVARLPRHYGLAHEEHALRAHYAVTTHGELIVRADGCSGDVIGAFPLPDPATAPNRMSFSGPISSGRGDTDLCFQFTSPLSAPFYAVERARLDDRR